MATPVRSASGWPTRAPVPGPAPLPVDALRRRCDPASLGCRDTEDLEPLEELLGQERAVEAIRFGVGIQGRGYNLLVMGPDGTGRHTLVERLLREQAVDEPTPSDWCYVNDFADPRRPRALELPPGRGVSLRQEARHLVEQVGPALQAALEGEAHRARRIAVMEAAKADRARLFQEAQRRGRAQGVGVVETSDGIALLPLRDGEVVEPGEFADLPEADREAYAREVKAVRVDIHQLLHRLEGLEAQAREEVARLDRALAGDTIQSLTQGLRRRWADLPAVCAWLEQVAADMTDRASELLVPASPSPGDLVAAALQAGGRAATLTRPYQVNVLVDQGARHGAPVVYEDRPSLPNLLGAVEHTSHLGNLVTDFTMVRAGALHRANGGYLVVDAARLLMEPYAWVELKRVLRARTLRIQSMPEILGLVGTETLEPEPIPFEAKVVLVSEPRLCQLLGAADPELHRLFKVVAEVEERVDGTRANEQAYARFIAHLVREAELPPVAVGGLAAMVEEARRRADDAGKLSVNLDALGDLLREAARVATRRGAPRIEAEDVRGALDGKRRRENHLEERLLEEVRRGHVVIDTGPPRVGQINGLAYLRVGAYAFGRPVRITARARMGSGAVVDIEREAHLGGDLHAKGVLILSSFLTSRYLPDQPLSLAATVTFEQSYGGVEGDSASLAELCALLSAVGGLPLPQTVAVTGSVDQHGRVQAVGGVNEKIEGFFAVCRERREAGPFGVVLPLANRDHLMLHQEVLEAVRAGWLRVWGVETVDEAMEVLTGLPAGTRDPGGRFRAGSVNYRVQARLALFAERTRISGRAGP